MLTSRAEYRIIWEHFEFTIYSWVFNLTCVCGGRSRGRREDGEGGERKRDHSMFNIPVELQDYRRGRGFNNSERHSISVSQILFCRWGTCIPRRAASGPISHSDICVCVKARIKDPIVTQIILERGTASIGLLISKWLSFIIPFIQLV